MFKVTGKSETAQVLTQIVNARAAKDIWGNPSNFGFTKVFSVVFIDERSDRNCKRELRYN